MGRFGTIEPGWEVYGSDGGQIGTVHVAGADHLEVEKGTFFIKALFIPLSAVRDIDREERRVSLSVSRDAVGNMGWTEPPVTAPVPQSGYRETWGQGTIDQDSASERREPDPDLVGSGAGVSSGATGTMERMTSTRIEEPADDLSAGQVPVERVDDETLEVWSEPLDEPGDGAGVDRQPRQAD